MSNNLLLMPKATAVWLIDNTTLTFLQIAEFCGMHEIEVSGIADGMIESGLKGSDPIINNQLTVEEINRCSADPDARLKHKLIEQENEPPSIQWIWPVIWPVPDSTGGLFVNPNDLLGKSALKLLGYTVGKTAGLSQSERQQFLSNFMEYPLPSIVKEKFGNEYGQPMSTDRFRKIANVIAYNAKNKIRSDRNLFRVAIEDWEADLEFLKKKYYIGENLRFEPWPSPHDI